MVQLIKKYICDFCGGDCRLTVEFVNPIVSEEKLPEPKLCPYGYKENPFAHDNLANWRELKKSEVRE